MSGHRLACVALALVCAAGPLSSCQTRGLAFTKDNRLTITEPFPRERVSTPFTVRWSMRDFDAVGLDGSSNPRRGVFAVFVDRAPMPVGRDLRWLARDDSSCSHDPRCPDVEYLRDHGVLVTASTSVTVSVLPAQLDGVGDEQHHITIVLLDGQGRRIGESAWYRAFTSRRLSP